MSLKESMKRDREAIAAIEAERFEFDDAYLRLDEYSGCRPDQIAEELRTSGVDVPSFMTVKGVAYRLIAMPSFSGIFTVTIYSDGVITLHVSKGQAGFESVRKYRLKHKGACSPVVIAALDTSGFWEEEWLMDTGLDGTTYILEGRKGDTYRVHSFWSPSDNHPGSAVLLAIREALPRRFRDYVAHPG